MPGPVIAIAAGSLLMIAAIGLEFAMVIRVVEPSPVFGLVGYCALLAGMLAAVLGILGLRRRG